MSTITASVRILRIDGANINLTSKTAERSGTATALDRITISRGAAGPMDHDGPSELTIQLISADPTGTPTGAEVNLAVDKVPGGETIWAWGYRCETDTVSQAGIPGRWLHTIHAVDVVSIASNRRVGITRPQETASVRLNALQNAHPDLCGTPDTVGADPIPWVPPLPVPGMVEPAPDPTLAPLDPDTTVLEARQAVASARGNLLHGGEGAELVEGPLPGDSLPVWWSAETYSPSGAIDLDQSILVMAPATTGRASRVGRATVEFLDSAGATQSTTFDAEIDLSSNLDLKTACEISDFSRLYWLAASIVRASADWPAPALDGQVRLTKVPTTASALLDHRPISARLVRITPTPVHCGQYHWVDATTVTINADRTIDLELTLTPAHLYGLAPIRLDQIPATVSLAAAIRTPHPWQSEPWWPTLSDLACARPPFQPTYLELIT